MTLLLTEGSHRASSSKAVRQVEKHTTQRAEDDEGIRTLKDKSIKDSAVERITKGAFIIFFPNSELPRATLFTIMVATSISNDNVQKIPTFCSEKVQNQKLASNGLSLEL